MAFQLGNWWCTGIISIATQANTQCEFPEMHYCGLLPRDLHGIMTEGATQAHPANPLNKYPQTEEDTLPGFPLTEWGSQNAWCDSRLSRKIVYQSWRRESQHWNVLASHSDSLSQFPPSQMGMINLSLRIFRRLNKQYSKLLADSVCSVDWGYSCIVLHRSQAFAHSMHVSQQAFFSS